MSCEDGGDGVAFRFDVFASAFLAIDEDQDECDFAAFFFDGLDGFEGGVAGGDDVIDDDDGSAGGEVAFDAPAAAVAFGFFADSVGLDGSVWIHHGRGHGEGEREGIGTEGEAADGGGSDAEAGGLAKVEAVKEATDEEGTVGVEGGDAAIDVEVALFAGGEGERAGFDGFRKEEGAEGGAIGIERHGMVLAWNGVRASAG